MAGRHSSGGFLSNLFGGRTGGGRHRTGSVSPMFVRSHTRAKWGAPMAWSGRTTGSATRTRFMSGNTWPAAQHPLSHQRQGRVWNA